MTVLAGGGWALVVVVVVVVVAAVAAVVTVAEAGVGDGVEVVVVATQEASCDNVVGWRAPVWHDPVHY